MPKRSNNPFCKSKLELDAVKMKMKAKANLSNCHDDYTFIEDRTENKTECKQLKGVSTQRRRGLGATKRATEKQVQKHVFKNRKCNCENMKTNKSQSTCSE